MRKNAESISRIGSEHRGQKIGTKCTVGVKFLSWLRWLRWPCFYLLLIRGSYWKRLLLTKQSMADVDDSPLFDEVKDPSPTEDESQEPAGGESKDEEKKEDEPKKASTEDAPASIPVNIEPELASPKDSKKVIILLYAVFVGFTEVVDSSITA